MRMNKIVIAAPLIFAASGLRVDTNLVINGSFETGKFTGWLRSGNIETTFVAPSVCWFCSTERQILCCFGS